jgi:hypothetical protein
MEPRQRALGPASTRFNDYVGTVAADDAEVVLDRPSLYELAHIERDRYTIVGIELNVDTSTTATVYAIDRTEYAISGQDEIVELGRSRGEIPVAAVDISEPHVEEFIKHAFKRISIRMATQDLRDQVLAVIESRSAENIEA